MAEQEKLRAEDIPDEEFSLTGGAEEQGITISSDLIRGHINTIILRSLYDGDKYGYDIINEIEKKSGGLYTLKQPTLYSALKRLEALRYVESYYGDFSNGGRRKYFRLTDKGKEITERNLSEWEYSRTIIDSLISDGNAHYDFSFITEKQKELLDIKKTLAARESALEDERNALNNLKNELQRERSLLSVQSSSLSTQKSDFNELKDKINAQKAELEEKQRILSEKQGEIDAKEIELNEKQNEIREAKAELERQRGEIDALKNTVESQKIELDDKITELDEVKASTVAQSEELEEKQSELSSLQEELAQKQDDLPYTGGIRRKALRARSDAKSPCGTRKRRLHPAILRRGQRKRACRPHSRARSCRNPPGGQAERNRSRRRKSQDSARRHRRTGDRPRFPAVGARRKNLGELRPAFPPPRRTDEAGGTESPARTAADGI
ncbi:MAG: helix-turn-helix transcriptional regulator [Christensenellaceae bacterium]